MKEAKDFFSKYPDAAAVLVVGDELYLTGFEKEAQRQATQLGVEVQRIENPRLQAKAKDAKTLIKNATE